jgi:hypothetical protein
LSFTQSLEVGGRGEAAVTGLLQSAGADVYPNRSATHKGLCGYDLRAVLGGREFTVEVKFDVMSGRTKNMAVEFENPDTGKPAGLFKTRADLWVVVLPGGEVYLTTVAALRGYFHSGNHLRDVQRAGDGNASVRLFRLETILPALFRRIDGLAPGRLAGLLLALVGEQGSPGAAASSFEPSRN